jgi:hypothetical protein
MNRTIFGVFSAQENAQKSELQGIIYICGVLEGSATRQMQV